MGEYRTVSEITGPLLVLEKVKGITYGELVEIEIKGQKRYGQVLDAREDKAIILVFGGTSDLSTKDTVVRNLGEPMKLPVGIGMLGRVFEGSGKPKDRKKEIVPEDRRDINGYPINPSSRIYPKEFIQTGISAIDGMNTLVRGQKLPIFSGSGLPHNLLAAQIARQAKILGKEEEFAIVFATMGITAEEARFFINDFKKTGALERIVVFLNLADDPAIERIITPRLALTAAEFLAFDHGMHVLVILTDISNYCESLREIAAAREEVPGRRGYPGYLFTDLATIYERTGIIKGKKGSITQLPIISMPGDDITHPIPDQSGYICEGQLVLKRELHRKGIYPPIDVLPSLSRLMQHGIGKGKTREDHPYLSDQLYAAYAVGRDLRDLVAILGEEALTETDRIFLKFAERFEAEFINQGVNENREIEETLDLGWEFLSMLPEKELKKIPMEMIRKFRPK